MAEVLAGLASNVDAAAARLHEACTVLAARHPGLRCSGVYRSPDHAGLGADYLNLAVGFDSEASAEALVAEFRTLEDAAGRQRDRPAQVALDIDLLWLGGRVQAGPRRLPHPEMLTAGHVLAPLVEIAGDRVHPETGMTLAVEWARLRAVCATPERLGALAGMLRLQRS